MSTLSRARNHYRRQQKIALLGVRAARRAVTTARNADEAVSAASTTLATYQLASALNGARTMATEAGRDLLTIPRAFAGTTQLGWPVETPIETIIDRLVEDLDHDLARLTQDMLGTLDLFVQSEVIAAGADAASVEIAAGPEWTNFVRVLVLPSCKRCVALAGKIYRDLEGFARHPLCDCQHWPVTSWKQAEAQGLVTDPMVAFERGQVRGLSKADTQAIQDGADLQAVVNATRGGGRRPQGMTNAVSAEIFGRTVKATLEGTTRRAEWRRLHPDLPIRLRPESIYEHAKDREDAKRLLELYGYIPTSSQNRVPSASGQGGGALPPRPPSSSTGAPDPSDDDLASWKRRQDALPLDFGGDVLQPWEVRTVEKMVSLGHDLTWVPQDRSTSTHDFVWKLDGEQHRVEMKSTGATWGAIHGRIVDSASRAWLNHRVVKDKFLIDIGDATLTPETRRQLARFNAGRRRYRLTRLWVMSQGQVEEIDLTAP